MNAPQTIPRTTVIAALDALGIKFEHARNITIVHITGDHISIESMTGETSYWRRIVDECASCHAPEGRPHTEYCKAPDPWTAPLDGIEVRTFGHDAVDLVDDTEQTKLDAIDAAPRHCRYPADDHGDGRGCQHDDCPKCGNPNEDGPGEPEPWVDNGCRCPNPLNHIRGCPVLEQAPLEGDFGPHICEDCPDRGICTRHAIT